MKSPAICVIPILALAGLCEPEAAWAQHALSVDYNAVHVVDLGSHTSLSSTPLNSSNPMFSCVHLAAEGDGQLFCAVVEHLYRIDVSAGEIDELATLPSGDA